MTPKKTPRTPKPGILETLQAQSDRRWSRGLPIAAMVISILSTIVGLLYQASRDREQSRAEKAQRALGDIRVGDLSSRIEVLSEAVRVLTALAAPELTRAIDDSLKTAVSSKDPKVTRDNTQKSASKLLSLDTSKIHTNPARLVAFGNDLVNIISKDTEDPISWNAAAILITYRSGVASGFSDAALPNCLALFQSYEPHPITNASRIEDMSLANCELVLDDVDSYWNSPFGQIYKTEMASGKTDSLRLLLSNVRLVSHGGELIPFKYLYCNDCTFRLETRTVVSARSRDIIKNLLVAQLNTVEIETDIPES